MDQKANRINYLWNKMRKNKPSDWLFCLWLTASLCFWPAFWFISRDEIFGRSEILMLGGICAAALIFSALISIFLFSKISMKIQLLFFAAVVGMIVVNFLPESINGSIEIIRGYQLEIIDMDEGAEVELVWAYWAEFPGKSDSEIMDYKHFRDISFSQFEQTGTWNISAEGFLVTAEKQAAIRLNSNGLHFHLPVPLY
ncbi:MAG: hypothetical protein AB9907_15545 [Flexilinea sp.]